MFAVASYNEAAEIRKTLPDCDILILGLCGEAQLMKAIQAGLQLTVFSKAYADKVIAAAEAAGRKARVHIKVETGLNRLGYAADEVTDAVAAARMAKINNISLDLIYGLPHQTMEQWQDTVRTAAALEVEHLSCYGLKVEEGTPLYARRESAQLPDDEAQAEMYLWTVDYLEKHGYHQYEISNFARDGYESRHNRKYWSLSPYAGFGPGAHSDFSNVRFAYTRDLHSYINGSLELSEREDISPRDRMQEYIMLSLRTVDGIDRTCFERQYRQRFAPMEPLLEQYQRHGLAAPTEKGWRLTAEGFLVSNAIIVSLQEAVGQAAQERLRRAQEGDFRILE